MFLLLKETKEVLSYNKRAGTARSFIVCYIIYAATIHQPFL